MSQLLLAVTRWALALEGPDMSNPYRRRLLIVQVGLAAVLPFAAGSCRDAAVRPAGSRPCYRVKRVSMAIKPEGRTAAKSESLTRLILPLRVAIVQ